MAGDWIKMRVWLRRDPRVASLADFLAADRRFMDHITDPVRRTCESTVYEHITRDVTRAITVSALLEVWGVARERGDRDGDDLILKHCDIDNLDAICSTPGFGEALEYVDWAIQEKAPDKKGRQISYVRFPNFFAENESPEDRYKKQHADAQGRYRAKLRAESDSKSDTSSEVTRDITVTPREEKRREEKEIPHTPKAAKSGATSLKTWLDAVKAKGELPIVADDPVFAYAAEIALPREFLQLAWREFRGRYGISDAKRYRDWRAVFRKAVRGNWLKLWYLAEGQYQLTTVGQQAKRLHGGKEAL